MDASLVPDPLCNLLDELILASIYGYKFAPDPLCNVLQLRTVVRTVLNLTACECAAMSDYLFMGERIYLRIKPSTDGLDLLMSV
jgi:hypothetical protein